MISEVLPGHYRGKFFCVETMGSKPIDFGFFTHVKEIEQKPLSYFARIRKGFEQARARRIENELCKPNPDFSFLNNEKSPYADSPQLRFRRIMKQAEFAREDEESIIRFRKILANAQKIENLRSSKL